MTNEELDKARGKEAIRIWRKRGGDHLAFATIAARLAREGWNPPEPVDPDLLAFRAFASKEAKSASLAEAYRDGEMDSGASARLFLAGARMAREQERERAGPLVEYVWNDAKRPDGAGDRARKVLAKYEGTL